MVGIDGGHYVLWFRIINTPSIFRRFRGYFDFDKFDRTWQKFSHPANELNMTEMFKSTHINLMIYTKFADLQPPPWR